MGIRGTLNSVLGPLRFQVFQFRYVANFDRISDFGSGLNVRVSSRVFHNLRVLGLIRESRVLQVWSLVSGRAGFNPKLIFLLGSGNYSFGSGFWVFGYPFQPY